MYNKYQQELSDLYMKQYFNIYPLRNIHSSYYANVQKSENYNNAGFMRLNIVRDRDKAPVPNATITIYVTDGISRDVPIMHLITTINPIRLELPMAYELGTQIVGPEYDFSTYNLRVDAFGYFSTNVYNIRLFPNTTSDFEINMVEVSQRRSVPDIEERIDIPPHPRDVINSETIR